MDKFDLAVKVVCGFFILKTIVRRFCTLFYVSIRYGSDGASTPGRIYSPHLYMGRSKTRMDKFNIACWKLFPNSRDYSDFNRYPYPYNIGEATKAHHYVRKTLPITVVSIIMLLWFMTLDPYELVKWYSVYVFGAWVFSLLCGKFRFLLILSQKRIPILNTNIRHLILCTTLRLIVAGKVRRRSLLMLILAGVGLIITL